MIGQALADVPAIEHHRGVTYMLTSDAEAAELADLIGEVWRAGGVERAAAMLLCTAIERPGAAEVTETVAALGSELALMRDEQLRRVAALVGELNAATRR
jgi:hypothetical protein